MASGHAGHAGSTESTPAHWTAALKLPNRRRTVFSDGLIPAAVHDAEVGKTPRSSTKRLTAARASSSLQAVAPELSASGRPRNCRVFELWRAQTKGQSIGGCESRPRKPPEEWGSKFSGVG